MMIVKNSWQSLIWPAPLAVSIAVFFSYKKVYPTCFADHHHAAVKACSSAFWKTFEALFASIGQDEKSYSSQQVNFIDGYVYSPILVVSQFLNVLFILYQLKLAEESCTSLAQNQSNGDFDQVAGL